MASALYRHTQRGTLIVSMLVITALIAGSIVVSTALRAPSSQAVLLIALLAIVGILGAVAWYFSSLTVEVSEQELRWNFGPGRPYVIPRSGIESVTIVRHPSWHGYGIRWIGPNQWTYIVSGRDVVEVGLQGGGWRRIGTDDPQGLRAALRDARLNGSAR